MAIPKSRKEWGTRGHVKEVALQSCDPHYRYPPLQELLTSTSSFQLPLLISMLRQSKRLKWVFACTAHAFPSHPCGSLLQVIFLMIFFKGSIKTKAIYHGYRFMTSLKSCRKVSRVWLLGTDGFLFYCCQPHWRCLIKHAQWGCQNYRSYSIAVTVSNPQIPINGSDDKGCLTPISPFEFLKRKRGTNKSYNETIKT